MDCMAQNPPPPSRCRPMLPGDLTSVVAIEKQSFPDPWGEVYFLKTLVDANGACSFVLEADGKVVGYFVIELEDRNARLFNLAVHPEHRRQGHASGLLAEVDRLCRESAESPRVEAEPRSVDSPGTGVVEPGGLLAEVRLEVEETNLAAQLLYRKMGYRATKVLRNHYGNKDGYKMVRRLYATPVGTAPH